MGVLADYLQEWGQYSFDEKGLTEADLLLFNEMSYLPFAELLHAYPHLRNQTEGIRFEALFRYFSADQQAFQDQNPIIINSARIKNWTLAARSPRYRNLLLSHFATKQQSTRQITEQFAAYTVDLTEVIGAYLLVYKGTDQDLAGWYENFLLATDGLMPAHQSAQDYCNQLMGEIDDPLILTGYSKGGNLAVFAGANCQKPDRILEIFTFDAPGFQTEFLQKPNYQRIQSKIRRYVPEDSIVGMILSHSQKPQVIKSHLFSVVQHFLFLWEIDLETGCLRRDIDSDAHIRTINRIIQGWLDRYSSGEIAFFLDLIFTILVELGFDDITQILDEWTTIIPQFKQQLHDHPAEDQERFMDMIRSLTSTAQDIIRADIKSQLSDWTIYKEQMKEIIKKIF